MLPSYDHAHANPSRPSTQESEGVNLGAVMP